MYQGSKRGKSFRFELPAATERMVRKAMGRDFDGHYITANGVAHAQRNHGVGGRKLSEGSIPLADADMELIPYIMTAPDRVERGSSDVTGRESVRFYKTLSNGYVVVAEKEYKNSPNDMETITMWAEMSPAATNARSYKNAPNTHVQNAILSTDAAKIRKNAEIALMEDVKNPEEYLRTASGENGDALLREMIEDIKRFDESSADVLAEYNKHGQSEEDKTKFRLLDADGSKAKGAMENAMAERVTELSERLHTPVRIIRRVAALPSVRQRRMKGSFNPVTTQKRLAMS